MKRNWIRMLPLLVLFAFVTAESDSCSQEAPSDKMMRQAQEQITAEGNSQVGLPAIKNFREKKLVKDNYELRDQEGLVTYTYTFSEMTGKYTFFCNSIGYGLPYATQFSNPQKQVNPQFHDGSVIAQAEPNGLFTPSSAEGTWVYCKNPNGPETRPVYVEPRIIVSPFKLPE